MLRNAKLQRRNAEKLCNTLASSMKNKKYDVKCQRKSDLSTARYNMESQTCAFRFQNAARHRKIFNNMWSAGSVGIPCVLLQGQSEGNIAIGWDYGIEEDVDDDGG